MSTSALALRTFAGAGVLRPARPDRLIAGAAALARYGPTPAAGYAAAAALFPHETALVDDAGTLTFRDVHRRSNAIAQAWRADGIGPGDNVALMIRNHRGWVEAVVACSKLGANAIFLNTSFSGPQVAAVCRSEGAAAVVYDDEFAPVLRDAGRRRRRYVAWRDAGSGGRIRTLEALAAGAAADPPRPPAPGRAIILTSGTTGTPKGASRGQPRTLAPALALLGAIPLRARERTLVAAPLFHAWGFAHFSLAVGLSSTLVLTRRFDPERTLAAIARERCSALAAVPVMLQRILELPPDVRARHDTSALRVVAVSGSALSPAVGTRWMDAFGDTLYNLYGSTEVAWATVATPRDLREAPGTAGRIPFGTVVRLYDDDGRVVEEPGRRGRIFVGNELGFEGYTGGGGCDELDGLLSTGDVGHFDADGRLFVDGRGDDMIVSGGENVFPCEVEDLLDGHPAVAEAAVLGVEDERFGERLRAVIVRRPGHDLGEDDVRRLVKDNLASYKVPRDVVFVDELPRTATGKVLRRELRDVGGAVGNRHPERPRRGPG